MCTDDDKWQTTENKTKINEKQTASNSFTFLYSKSFFTIFNRLTEE